MQVIPAIDVSGGRLARLDSGRPVSLDSFEGEPMNAAKAFMELGASWIHLVDMDRAFDGVATSLDLLSQIAALGMHVQASGGISNAEEVSSALDAGAERAVLGSGALTDMDAVVSMVARFGERLIIGIETDGETIRPRGRWGQEAAPAIDLGATVSAVVAMSASRLLVTTVGRVGGMGGADIATIETLMPLAKHVPVIASGGATGIDEMGALSAAGLEAVVIGRALYEGGLDLAVAIEAAR